jgi:hypothetical protein
MKIGKDILSRSAQQVKEMLEVHEKAIDGAFDSGDEILEINFKIRYSFVDGKLKMACSTNFVTDRVKDQAIAWYDPEQKQLFEEGA